LFLAWAIR